MLFLVDIAINFNTAVPTDTGVNTSRCYIAKNYLLGWFWIDFPSSIPLKLGFEISAMARGDETSGTGSTFQLLKLLRMARFLKLIRLLKAAKIFKVFEDELDINVRHDPTRPFPPIRHTPTLPNIYPKHLSQTSIPSRPLRHTPTATRHTPTATPPLHHAHHCAMRHTAAQSALSHLGAHDHAPLPRCASPAVLWPQP